MDMPDQSQVNVSVRAAIRKLMRKHKTRYRDLAIFLKVSESTVKRIVTKENLTLERIEQICHYFGINFFELMEIAREDQLPVSSLNEEQESYLALHPNVARYFWLLLNGMSTQEIQRRFNLSDEKLQSYEGKLDTLGLLTRSGDGSVKLKIHWPIGFKRGGAMYKLLVDKTFHIFLSHLLARVNAADAKSVEDFTVRLFPLILTPESYQACLNDINNALEKWVKVSRLQLATENEESLQLSSLMIGMDKYDAVGAVLGPL